MEQPILRQVDALLAAAHADGRHTLFEHEVYELLKLIGFQIPLYRFVTGTEQVTEQLIAPFGGKDIMVKVVSRDLAHNQRYGGVKKVGIADPLFIRYVLSHMREEVLSHFADGEKPRIDGFLLIEFIHFTQAIGDEIMVGFQDDPAFGTVVTLSKGGDDAEFFAKYYDPANLLIAPIIAGRREKAAGQLEDPPQVPRHGPPRTPGADRLRRHRPVRARPCSTPRSRGRARRSAFRRWT